AASRLNGKLFQWQIQDGSQWLDVAHDDIIEAQYTLPMVEGIRLHTARHGTIYLDFDKMEIVGSNLKLKRLTFPPTQEMDEYSWYFLDDHSWREYGVQGEGGTVCSINSQDIEQSYQQNPQGSLQFTAGHFQYRLDLSAMTQINLVTHTRRAVRRLQTPSLQGAHGSTGGNGLWQFLDEEGLWQEYSQPGILKSVSSQDIETIYQMNPQGSMRFSAGWFSYSLDFSAMTQTNLTTRKVRQVRRL
ncbi:hypothetical protein chiPu_0015935, partial [Chiloscyllium punctatum]|nr:hypothetical protein [Chiloscyllium punctatum]